MGDAETTHWLRIIRRDPDPPDPDLPVVASASVSEADAKTGRSGSPQVSVSPRDLSILLRIIIATYVAHILVIFINCVIFFVDYTKEIHFHIVVKRIWNNTRENQLTHTDLTGDH